MKIGQIYCLGRNYAEHARELGNPVLKRPLIFIKPTSCLIPNGSTLTVPPYGGECHHEVELAVQIDKPLLNATREQAEAAICAYALCLDMTLRGLQSELKSKSHPWATAKGFPQSLPISEFIAAKDIDDPEQLSIVLHVNGELRQNSKISHMQLGLIDCIAYVSEFFQLCPGDLILTGTPKGVAKVEDGDKLHASLGDILELDIAISRPVVAGNE